MSSPEPTRSCRGRSGSGCAVGSTGASAAVRPVRRPSGGHVHVLAGLILCARCGWTTNGTPAPPCPRARWRSASGVPVPSDRGPARVRAELHRRAHRRGRRRRGDAHLPEADPEPPRAYRGRRSRTPLTRQAPSGTSDGLPADHREVVRASRKSPPICTSNHRRGRSRNFGPPLPAVHSSGMFMVFGSRHRGIHLQDAMCFLTGHIVAGQRHIRHRWVPPRSRRKPSASTCGPVHFLPWKERRARG